MKNQYFGDVNDYRKYGLLRILSGDGWYKVGVCWMLTENDARSDGKLTAYLHAPQRWRNFDAVLFDFLYDLVVLKGRRNVNWIQNIKIMPGAHFHNEQLGDSLVDRKNYFDEAKKKLADCDLIFFDPDNGIEIKSKPKGTKGSSKYIFWDEISKTYHDGRSVLVYQHFRRELRITFIENLLAQYRKSLNTKCVYCLSTSQVAYFLCVQDKHADYVAPRIDLVSTQWNTQIQVKASN